MNEAQLKQEDELDIYELWAALVKYKMSILTVTIIVMLSAAIYVWTVKPVYKGEVLIEIGTAILNSDPINDKPTIIEPIEAGSNLQGVIEQTFNTNVKEEEEIEIDFPKGSTQLIRISYEHTDKRLIHKKLEQVTAFILNRHHRNAEFLKKANAKIHSSRLAGTIKITIDPIKPKKSLSMALALVTGLILGILLAFFRAFILNGRVHNRPVKK